MKNNKVNSYDHLCLGLNYYSLLNSLAEIKNNKSFLLLDTDSNFFDNFLLEVCVEWTKDRFSEIVKQYSPSSLNEFDKCFIYMPLMIISSRAIVVGQGPYKTIQELFRKGILSNMVLWDKFILLCNQSNSEEFDVEFVSILNTIILKSKKNEMILSQNEILKLQGYKIELLNLVASLVKEIDNNLLFQEFLKKLAPFTLKKISKKSFLRDKTSLFCFAFYKFFSVDLDKINDLLKKIVMPLGVEILSGKILEFQKKNNKVHSVELDNFWGIVLPSNVLFFQFPLNFVRPKIEHCMLYKGHMFEIEADKFNSFFDLTPRSIIVNTSNSSVEIPLVVVEKIVNKNVFRLSTFKRTDFFQNDKVLINFLHSFLVSDSEKLFDIAINMNDLVPISTESLIFSYDDYSDISALLPSNMSFYSTL